MLLLTFFVVWAAKAGPMQLVRPASILTNSDPAQRASVPYLIFLHDVGKRLPVGATVLLIEPRSTKLSDATTHYLLALAELPSQNVIPVTQDRLEAWTEPGAPYAASFAAPLQSPLYKILSRSGTGALYEVVR